MLDRVRELREVFIVEHDSSETRSRVLEYRRGYHAKPAQTFFVNVAQAFLPCALLKADNAQARMPVPHGR